jgi:hypothetical protein
MGSAAGAGQKKPLGTRSEIDAILSHLPTLESQKGSHHRVGQHGWLVYTHEVRAFFRSVAPVAMRLEDHHDLALREMVGDKRVAESADIDQILGMLGVCFHWERVYEGIWCQLLDKGFIFRLLHRLRCLRDAL